MNTPSEIPCSKCGLLRLVGGVCKPCRSALNRSNYVKNNPVFIKMSEDARKEKNRRNEKARVTYLKETDPERYTLENSVKKKKKVEKITVSYVASCLRTTVDQVTPKIYELYIEKLQIIRLKKELKKALNDTN